MIIQIRDTVGKALMSCLVEAAIGYEAGSTPLSARPVIIRDVEEVDKLICDPYRSGGIALHVRRYLLDRKSEKNYDASKPLRVAVVARPCDVKAMVNHIKEKQYTRANIYIVGIHCPGIIDRQKLYKEVDPFQITAVAVGNGQVTVESRNGDETKLFMDDVITASCIRCTQRYPDKYIPEEEDDAEQEPEQEATPPVIEPFAVVKEHEKKSIDERWLWFKKEIGRCIRCRACRQTCPMCYCKTCFADQTNPGWIGQTSAEADVMGFHIGRLLHMAGRCVDCGECETACPMNIPLTVLNQKLDQVIFDLYGYESGVKHEEEPPLSTYKPDDPDKGFM
ncbi:MAG: hypothetical protein GY765_40220 [bacterium]|nr:hypothetical protein [bacterium]